MKLAASTEPSHTDATESPAVVPVGYQRSVNNAMVRASSVGLESVAVSIAPAIQPDVSAQDAPASNSPDSESGLPGQSSNAFANSPIPINLPTALAIIGGHHPVVALARWRVQEAYAVFDRTQAAWLPSIQSGISYHRHDGNYQAVDGSIVDINSNSLQYGLGVGAIAAGTTPRPGVVAQFHLADAIFLSNFAEKTAWAQGHAATAALNQQLLVAGTAYIDLLDAYQDMQIMTESARRTAELADITQNFAEAGQGLPSDSDRMSTERALLQNRLLSAQERRLVSSTRLARALSIPMSTEILPQDTAAVPLKLMEQLDEPTLIATGLTSRPELKESQALVSAACEAFRREKFAPFVPSVLLGVSTGGFGGGLSSKVNDFGDRYDFDALMMWEVRNLGFGERAARRERNAQVQQAMFNKLRMMDQVAQEVAEANAQVVLRRQQVDVTQNSIQSARDSYRRNLDRIRNGQGLPIEALQSVQALESAQRAYLRAVIDYNRAQLQLQWALGWPANSIPDAEAVDP